VTFSAAGDWEGMATRDPTKNLTIWMISSQTLKQALLVECLLDKSRADMLFRVIKSTSFLGNIYFKLHHFPASFK
jgi:hypothetical protein